MGDAPIILIGIASVLVVSVLCGLTNGFFVAYVGVVPLLVTLGTQTVFNGISLNITRGSGISGFPKVFQQIGAGTLFDVPYTLIIYLLVVLVAWYLVQKTPGALMCICWVGMKKRHDTAALTQNAC